MLALFWVTIGRKLRFRFGRCTICGERIGLDGAYVIINEVDPYHYDCWRAIQNDIPK